MDRAQKKQEIENLNASLSDQGIVVVTHYAGLTVAQITKLRGDLRKEGASFKVTKNTLAKLALKGTKFENISPMLTGPTGIASSKDPIAAARIANNFAKTNDKLIILGGAMDGKLLNAAEVKQLATLPSLNELRSKIVGLLQAPATKIAGVLQAPARQLVGVTKAYGEKV